MSCDTPLSNMLWTEDGGTNELKKYLEQDSACVNKADSYGEVLMFYVQSNKSCRLDVIQLLLKYGANINFKDPGTCCTPLIAALQKVRDTTVIKLLLESGADVLSDCSNYQEPFPLCIALHFGASKDVVKLLFDAGCSLNGCPKHLTAIHCAIHAQWSVRSRPGLGLKEEVLHLLIEKGADANAIDTYGRTVICYALWMGCQASFIKMLLKVGTSLNGCVRHPSTFHCAIQTSITLSTNVAKLLLDHHVSMLNDVDIDGLILSLLRFKNYEVDTVELLLHHLTDVDIVDKKNNNLLNLVIINPSTYNGMSDVVELLIKRGVGIDMANIDGNQPLHLATCRYCSPDFIKMLLKNGAPLNVKNGSGETPLQIAMKFGRSIKIVKVLFAAGSHVEVRNPLIFWLLLNGKHLGQEGFKVECYKLLTKYFLLLAPFFDIPFYEDHLSFDKFAEDCAVELTKMDSVFVGQGRTLREFLIKYSPYQKYSICERAVDNYDWNQLLRIKAGSAFPMFRDIIWEKVDRPFMEAKLYELRVYTYANEACQGEKIFLNYNVVCKIAEKLSDDCLFSLIIAFSNDQATSIPSGIKEKSGEKRNAEESSESGKRMKLMATKFALP